ncbi:alkane 1-monooxygenase [Robiginitomaculum antarcticum]|uniref:alkane 1-monooxygenase n=1 Tax=Robiginitomaculum antarcticum TaxID=437507 RepID=UPI0003733D51|nr:alkane 1-monooxygenase [Robiginitomaculum antarcticum]
MTVFTGTDEQGQTVSYNDHKRYWYLLAYTHSIIVASFYAAFLITGAALWLVMPVIWIFGIVPTIDLLVGEDTHNPPEAVMPAMIKDDFYRFSIYPHFVIAFAMFAFTIFIVGSFALPWWAYLALVISSGIGSGGILTLTHELGHKTNKLDQFMAKIGNALVGYGHFCIEHNRGHHVMVSTPEDPASARMGESIYRFAFREIGGTFARGWHHERERLAKLGHGFWHYKNDVLQSYALSFVIIAICVAVFGPLILAFIVPHHIIGWYTLTQANYIEHYGLLRAKKANGKYERTQPRHSWNTNHLFSNMQLFHLQRHSDHHANPLRPYQVLRNFDDLPSLPNGYLGCYSLAAIPPLWYRIMDKKVMDWAGGDITKVNIDPKAKARLYRKYSPELSLANKEVGSSSAGRAA